MKRKNKKIRVSKIGGGVDFYKEIQFYFFFKRVIREFLFCRGSIFCGFVFRDEEWVGKSEQGLGDLGWFIFLEQCLGQKNK